MLALLASWERALTSDTKSEETIKSYVASVRQLAMFPAEEGMDLSPDAIRAFLTEERERTSAWTAQKHYQNLSFYFGWLVRESNTGLEANPMELVTKLKTNEVAKPISPTRT